MHSRAASLLPRAIREDKKMIKLQTKNVNFVVFVIPLVYFPPLYSCLNFFCVLLFVYFQSKIFISIKIPEKIHQFKNDSWRSLLIIDLWHVQKHSLPMWLFKKKSSIDFMESTFTFFSFKCKYFKIIWYIFQLILNCPVFPQWQTLSLVSNFLDAIINFLVEK